MRTSFTTTPCEAPRGAHGRVCPGGRAHAALSACAALLDITGATMMRESRRVRQLGPGRGLGHHVPGAPRLGGCAEGAAEAWATRVVRLLGSLTVLLVTAMALGGLGVVHDVRGAAMLLLAPLLPAAAQLALACGIVHGGPCGGPGPGPVRR